jgi:hypothetical protein
MAIGNAQESTRVASQKFTVVSLPVFYKEKGVIFDNDYVVGIEMHDMRSRFTPSTNDITKAEGIFIDKYNEVQKANVDTKSYFFHWVRQYVGVIDKNNTKNIIVQLINNKKRIKTNHLLGKGWEDNFVIMLADSFYSISKRFKINIDTGEMYTEL